jgi:hypothetical protein
MRSCSGAMRAFASVTMIVKLATHSPLGTLPPLPQTGAGEEVAIQETARSREPCDTAFLSTHRNLTSGRGSVA